MSADQCPECGCLLTVYLDGDFHVTICWDCGYYSSDSEGFKSCPDLFRNIVRNNSSLFMKKYLKVILTDEKKQLFRTDEEGTDPKCIIYKGLPIPL
jgi:hypothetical protein